MENSTKDIDYTYLDPADALVPEITPHVVNVLLEDGDISVEEYRKYTYNHTYIPKLKEKI